MRKKNFCLGVEQQVVRELSALEALPTHILVAVSGGVDSLVLLRILHNWRRRFGWQLSVAYVHHGVMGRIQADYRKKAFRRVQSEARRLQLPFFSNWQNGRLRDGWSPPASLRSEAELREYRYQVLRRLQTEADAEAVALGHHAQDLLETRMMRLIRGTGDQGLEAMCVWNAQGLLRPLLRLNKSDLQKYARQKRMRPLEDPSNRRMEPFRNWLRGWLAQLEKRSPGSLNSLARSLSQIGQTEVGVLSDPSVLTTGGINRQTFIASSRSGKLRLLASYCREVGLRDYSAGHLNELIKRLDVAQNELRFSLLKTEWIVTRERIQARNPI